MNCPYCRTPMEEGFTLNGKGVIAFVKKYQVAIGLLPTDRESEEFLLPHSFLKGTFLPSQYCKECDKIIISLKEEEP